MKKYSFNLQTTWFLEREMAVYRSELKTFTMVCWCASFVLSGILKMKISWLSFPKKNKQQKFQYVLHKMKYSLLKKKKLVYLWGYYSGFTRWCRQDDLAVYLIAELWYLLSAELFVKVHWHNFLLFVDVWISS